MLKCSDDDLETLQKMGIQDLYRGSYAEYEELNIVFDYLHTLQGRDATSMPMAATVSQLPRPQVNHVHRCSVPMPGENDHRDLLVLALGCSQWKHLSHYCNSPLKYISFDPFRKSGFALWSRERMAALGLIHPRKRGHGSKSSDYYFLR